MTIRPLTVAGAAQVRLAVVSITLLLPVELRRVNHVASTNVKILTTDIPRHGDHRMGKLLPGDSPKGQPDAFAERSSSHRLRPGHVFTHQCTGMISAGLKRHQQGRTAMNVDTTWRIAQRHGDVAVALVANTTDRRAL